MEQIVFRVRDQQGFGTAGYFYQLTNGKSLCRTPHRHEFYEIVSVLRGTAWHHVNGQKQELAAGDVVFLSPADLHFFLRQSPDANIFSVSVSCALFVTFIGIFGGAPRFAEVCRSSPQRLEEEAAGLFATHDERVISLRVKALVLRLLAEALEDDLSSAKGTPAALRDAVRTFAARERLDGGVNELVRLSGYSRAQLSRLIHRHYGETPHGLVLRLRMSRALELIQHTDVPFDKVAWQVGYESCSRFYAVIAERFGATPGELRRGKSSSAE